MTVEEAAHVLGWHGTFVKVATKEQRAMSRWSVLDLMREMATADPFPQQTWAWGYAHLGQLRGFERLVED